MGKKMPIFGPNVPKVKTKFCRRMEMLNANFVIPPVLYIRVRKRNCIDPVGFDEGVNLTFLPIPVKFPL